jgi:hypothetical protein
MTGQEEVSSQCNLQEENKDTLLQHNELAVGTMEHSTDDKYTPDDSNENTMTELASVVHDDVSKSSDIIVVDNISNINEMLIFVPTTEYNNEKYCQGYIVKL